MKFIHNALGHRQRDEIVEVTLTSGANVRLMNSPIFQATRTDGVTATLAG